jgi:hypothetical protein
VAGIHAAALRPLPLLMPLRLLTMSSACKVNFNWRGSLPCSRKASSMQLPVCSDLVGGTAPEEATKVSASVLQSMTFFTMSPACKVIFNWHGSLPCSRKASSMKLPVCSELVGVTAPE